MFNPASSAPAPYITVIPQVREVTLLGSADLAFWQGCLAPEGLAPSPAQGRAQLVLSAPDLRWSGIRFQEFSIAVVAGPPPDGEPAAGLYLAGAYNSSRLLAFLERALFQTPYDHRPTRVDAAFPASISVGGGAGDSFRAAMAPSARRLWSRDDGWEGTIFLPSRHRARRRWFRARLGGPTDAYPFDPAGDALAISPPAGDSLLRLLVDSQFTPGEWRVRTASTHARSRTYESAR